MKTIQQKQGIHERLYRVVLLSLCLFLWALLPQAQTEHPDQVYPIPQNYRSVNRGGVNLLSGDLNLDMPLAAIAGRQLGYSLEAFYNSRSADLDPVDNALGGQGWKLLDYPKIVWDGTTYHYLDGQRSYPLVQGGDGLITDAPYHLWRFQYDVAQNIWTLTDDSGVQYKLGNRELNGYSIWHLSQMWGSTWGDTLDFTYQEGRLMSITNALGDQLQVVYDAASHITAVEVHHNRTVEGRQAELRSRTRLGYDDNGRLVSIENDEQLSTGTFTDELPGIQFTYNEEGRIGQTISPSGVVQLYKYHRGNEHPEIQGCVIHYSSDNGYEIDKGENIILTDYSPKHTYSAVWYDLDNHQYNDIYRSFNKVRVYPGGYYLNENSRDDHTHDNIHNPFGHKNYYFFNGTLFYSVPTSPSAGTDTTHSNLRGMVYRMETYNDEAIQESEDHLVSTQQYIYALTGYEGIQVPLLQQRIASRDGVEDQLTWYAYNKMTLPVETVYARRSPKRNDASHKEYARTQQKYAYEDHPELLTSYNLLTAVTQRHSATATYTGDTPHTDSSLEWEVTDASISRWKTWENAQGHGWAPYEHYVLKESLVADTLSMDLPTTLDGTHWLRTGETLNRNKWGIPLSHRDLDGIATSTLYDQEYGLYPVASFHHADATMGEAGYLGLEKYETFEGWALSGGEVSLGEAHTGFYAYGGNESIAISRDITPREGVAYVLGAFVKNKGSSTGTLGFKNGSQWSASTQIPANSNWQYVSATIDAPSSGDMPTIECNDCLVDDIRFHPVDASFSATVYWDHKVENDSLTVMQTGEYRANHKIELASDLSLLADSTLHTYADDLITIPEGVSIAEGATFTADLADFSLRMDRPVATLGANGETYRRVYDALGEAIALVGPNETLRGLNIVYNSQQNMKYFGDSEADDPHFDGNYPNMHMQVVAREDGVWEGFEEGGHFVSLNDMAVVGNRLQTQLASAQATADYAQEVNATDYALYAELLPKDISGEQKMGIDLGQGQVEFLLTGTQLLLKSNGNKLASVSLLEAPDHLNLLLTVMDGTHVFAYANGRFLFDHTFGNNLQGQVQLVSTHPGGAFDNFMYLEDPLVGKQTYDALGQQRQSLIHHEPDELYVSETLYGDHLNLPMAATRPTHVNTEGGTRGLSFRGDFANLNYQDGENGGTVTTTGEVSSAHGYATPFVASRTYHNDPSLRSNRVGSGGAFTAGKSHSVDKSYTTTQGTNAFGFGEDHLGKTTDDTPYTQNQQVSTHSYTDAATGLGFASSQSDMSTGETQHEQAEYDEQLRLTKHYQPNAFDATASGSESYYRETGYDFLGNVVFEYDPDEGVTQYAYDPAYRHRLMLDAEGVAGHYYRYWKYDPLGRVIEEGRYNAQGKANFYRKVDSDTLTGEATETAINKLTMKGTFAGEVLRLEAGVQISLGEGYSEDGFSEENFSGFSIDATAGHEMFTELVDDALSQTLGELLADPSWPYADDNRKVKRTYTYDRDTDAPDNLSLGRVVSTTVYDEAGDTSSSSTERYGYDLEGRVVAHTLEVQTFEKPEEVAVTNYGYDLLGQVKIIQSDAQASNHGVAYEAAYTYDRLGRVKSIGSLDNPSAYATYSYDNHGFTESMGGVLVNRYTTNEENYLQSIDSRGLPGLQSLFHEQLYYTDRSNGAEGYYNGNIAEIGYTMGGDSWSHNYDYDGFGRLTAVDGSDYVYDPNGNIREKDGIAYQYYQGDNRLNEWNGNIYEYDISGRTFRNGRHSFTYDPFTGLTKTVSKGSTELSFRYGPSGQRIGKVVNDDQKKIRYLHGLNDYPLIELVKDSQGEHAIQYIYGPTGMIALRSQGAVDSGGWNYVVKDHLGSTRVVVNSYRNTVASFNYDAFGSNLLTNPSPFPNVPVYYRYTGQEYDEEVGLYNYRARMYDPVVGRFLTPDPLRQQHSAYAYVGNNPISFTDPTGAWFGWDDAATMGIGLLMGGAGELISEVISGNGIHWSKVGVAALAGAVDAELSLYAGPLAGGAISGAINQLGDNLIDGKRGLDAFNGVATAVIAGGISGGVGSAVGHGVGKIAGEEVGLLGSVAAGAVSGGATSGAMTMGGNIVAGRSMTDGLGSAVLLGAINGGVSGGIGHLATRARARLGCGCFTEGTQVKTEDGYKDVKDIVAGDKVWAYDDTTGEQALKEVVETFSLTREATYTLHIGAETLEASSDHPFYTGERWVAARDLRPQDAVQLFSGATATIDSIRFTAGHTKVYNFEVADFHTYYVGGNDWVLVHNATKCSQTFNKRHGATTKREAKRQANSRLARGEKMGIDKNDRQFNTSVNTRQLKHRSRSAVNPSTGRTQFVSENVGTYTTKFDKKGRAKAPRFSKGKVYFDKKGGKIYHLDGTNR